MTIRKSKNGRFRVIPMTQRVAKLLGQRVPFQDSATAVLPGSDISRPLAKASEEAGIGHVHMHMLRHTCATRLRDRGVPLDRVMEIRGHSSYQMVLRYAKARP